MTVAELNQAFRADGAKKWSDIRSDWPDDDIIAYYPGADSGTFDYFNEAIIEEFEGSTHRGDGTPSEDDNILALGIGRDKQRHRLLRLRLLPRSGPEPPGGLRR